jgi:hypothetical protein
MLCHQEIVTFYGTRKFITVFTTARRRCVPINYVSEDCARSYCLFRIHFNIILPSTLKSSSGSPPLYLCNQNFIHISHLFREYYMPLPFYYLFFIVVMFIDEYKLWRFSL